MSKTPEGRTTNLDIRLPADQMSLVEHAAEIQGSTVIDFVADALVSAARSAIEEQKSARLSARDRDLFLKLLNDDTEPSANLSKAARRYKARFA